MGTAVKKTISLPPDLAREGEEIASEEGKTLSAVIQNALRITRRERLKREFIDCFPPRRIRQGRTLRSQ